MRWLCAVGGGRHVPPPPVPPARMTWRRLRRRPAEVIARRFHDEYEHLAPMYGWSTQEASRVAWSDLPEDQRQLMVHTVANLLAEGVILANGDES